MRAGHFWGSGCVVAVACWGEGGEGGVGAGGRVLVTSNCLSGCVAGFGVRRALHLSHAAHPWDT